MRCKICDLIVEEIPKGSIEVDESTHCWIFPDGRLHIFNIRKHDLSAKAGEITGGSHPASSDIDPTQE
jgi:hypothetical protein